MNDKCLIKGFVVAIIFLASSSIGHTYSRDTVLSEYLSKYYGPISARFDKYGEETRKADYETTYNTISVHIDISTTNTGPYCWYGPDAYSGKDCANFASQALIKGGYYAEFSERHNAEHTNWTIIKAADLNAFLKTAPFATSQTLVLPTTEAFRIDINTGDIIIWGANTAFHATIVSDVKKSTDGTILSIGYSAHSNNAKPGAILYDKNAGWLKANKGWNMDTMRSNPKFKKTINIYHVDDARGTDTNKQPNFVCKDPDAENGPTEDPDDDENVDGVGAKDPNYMSGPTGSVTPGQTMTYTTSFENEGEGTAFSVYVTDVLDTNLDDSRLVVKDFYLVDWATQIKTPTSFAYSYDPKGRTLTVFAGDFGPGKGGMFTVETKLKDTTPLGTQIPNYATVYFPSVLEQTPTNIIMSVVPKVPVVAYSGPSTGSYGDYAEVMGLAKLEGQPFSGKDMIFSIANASATVTTDSNGEAYPSMIMNMPPGNYALSIAYPGDGYYYTSSTKTVSITILPGQTFIPSFSTTTYSTSAVSLDVNLYNINGTSLLPQTQGPRSLRLLYQDTTTWVTIGTSQVSSDTAHFVFNLPLPVRASYTLKAVFDGDDRYIGTASTSVLTVLEVSSPTITILSPVGGVAYSTYVPVNYVVADNLDNAPTSYAYLTSLASGTPVPALNGSLIPVASLANSSWTMTVVAQNFSGNISTAVTAAFSVMSDTTPPTIALITPSTSAVGVERAFTGTVAIAASAYDLHLSSWSISFASAVSSTWTVVSSGTVALSSGTAVFWNTSALSGYYSLRLSACDSAGNCSTQIAPVYIGLPQLAQTMGRLEKTRLNLQSPRGIAIGPDGLIWIADAGVDRVLGVNSSGVVVHEIGNGCPRRTSVRLARPQSVAVDASGNIYVADTGNHRVLKLTASGVLLLEISQNNRQACKLLYPSAIALDAAGNIYVADKNHSRVSVFSPTGQLLRSFNTSLPSDDYHLADSYSDTGWDLLLRLIFDYYFGHDSRPAGITISGDGSIWISDERQNRLLQFSSTGTLLKTIGSTGTQAGQLRRPGGLEIDRVGQLYVPDRLNRRVQKLSASGRPCLSITEGLYQPADLAFAANGDLWVIDTFRCSVSRYSLPAAPVNLVRTMSGASASFENQDADAAVADGRPTATSLLNQLEPDHALYITDIGIKVGKLVNTSGGNVTHTNGALAQLPAGALPSEIEVTIAESTHTVAQHDAYLKTRRLMSVSAPYEFGPDGLSFATPATLTLPYDSSQIPSNKTLSDVAIYNWDDITGAWVPLETQFVNGKLAAKTTHFSVYQAMVSGVNPLAATTFAFRQFYVYPNPAKGGNRPTLHFECGIGDGADIRIYDVAGDLRHSAHMTGAPNISAPEYAYEYTWDMGGAGSGVYTAVMEAHNGGETVKAKKKFAIIR